MQKNLLRLKWISSLRCVDLYGLASFLYFETPSAQSEVQMALDASTIQMQRISRNFVVSIDDFKQMGGTKNLAKRLQERGFVFSCNSELKTNVGKLNTGMRDKVSTFEHDKRFMCDRNVLQKVLGGTTVTEKQTKICVQLSTRDSTTFEEARYVEHCGEASHSVEMQKVIPTKQNLNVLKQDNIQARDEKGDYYTSTRNLSENDAIILSIDSSDPDDTMLKQSNVTGENIEENNLGPLQEDICVDNICIKSLQNLTIKFKDGHHTELIKQEAERRNTSPVETNDMEKLKITSMSKNGRHFKRYRMGSEGNITGAHEDLACLNDDIHMGNREVEDEIIEGNSQKDIEELVPIDKIATTDIDLCSTKPILNRTRTCEYTVNLKSKADFGTWNPRSKIKKCMKDEICQIGQRKGKGQNEIAWTSEPTNKNVSLHVNRSVGTKPVLHCGSSRQDRKCKTSNSSALKPKRRTDICSDQSQEDDLVFLKMELKEPVVVVEKLDHLLVSDEVRCKRKRIKLEPMEGDDKIHSQQLQTHSIQFERELVKDTSYKKFGRRKTTDKWLEEIKGQEDMPHEKQLDSRQEDFGGDGPKQMNNTPKPLEQTRRRGHKKQFNLHQQADLPTLNIPHHNDNEEVVFLGMKLNDPFIVLGDTGKNTNYIRDHKYQQKKIKLESALENTARGTIQFDPPSHTVEQFETSSNKYGKCNDRTKEGEKQNHCLKATINGMSSERPVCMQKCKNLGEALIPNAAQGVEYKANFSCLTRKRMSQKGLYKLHNVNEGVLKDFYIYLLKERGNRTAHCAQITRSVSKILFYFNPHKLDISTLTNKTKLVHFYQELKAILKASSITIFIKSLYVFIEFLETMTNRTEHLNVNSVKTTLKNLKHLNTRCVQKEMAHRHFNMTFKKYPNLTDLGHQLKFSKRLMTQEIEKAKQKHQFSICKLNIYFYMVFAFKHFQRKCVFENLTTEEWNERFRHTTDMEETYVILAIKNHKTLSSQLAMIALSEEEEEQMKQYLNFVRPKTPKKEFFLTSTGNKIRDASHLLTCYQKMYKLPRITGTQARRILETNTWNIKENERRSICDYLCHSTRVAEKYYRLKTPQSCVYARKVVQRLINAA
ncbi:hypothetical protein CHS0354_011286 [Potamilus streckersoni]|uniref:Core-binding (CB) domain-containing protein n=1 Tax=Potamilus streckersoni TaxID=2493646 RepID=A0AAE0S9J0_9BIVA|nr:hypothetical protein CHS0354_011286 [Potamilus streckersoni]